MTAPHIVDPAGLLGQALSVASPDLMRELLQTMITALHEIAADISYSITCQVPGSVEVERLSSSYAAAPVADSA